MRSLYDIQIEYAELIAQLNDLEGELTPEMEVALTINKKDLERKAEAYALRIMEFTGQADMIRDEADRLMKRAMQVQKTADRLKTFIDAAMRQYGVDKIKTDKVTLSFRKSSSVEVMPHFAEELLRFIILRAEIDEEKLKQAQKEAKKAGATPPPRPDEEMLDFFNLRADLSKTKLKDALKEGRVIKEVSIVEKQNLQVK